MLCVDHVNNDGAAHRKSISAKWKNAWANKNIGGTRIYSEIVKAGFPNTFQLLCANCNTSKARNGGVCEHLTEGATTREQSRTAKRLEAPNIPSG